MTPFDYGKITSVYMMPYEIEAVVSHIQSMPSDGTMVEWGSGGSTCKWLEILSDTQKLISIESNRYWFDIVTEETSRLFPNKQFEYLLRTDDVPEVGRVDGTLSEEYPFGLSDYINPGESIFDADIFFIDGIARSACAAAVAIKRRKPNSYILWHDYTERLLGYNWISQFFTVEHLCGTLVKVTF